MLISITNRTRPATDLGYLLHKHPDRFQTFAMSGGQAHVFYPEADDEICTCTLLCEVDPVTLVRGKPGERVAGKIRDYVNDRTYSASSVTAVTMADIFRSAINGRCAAREALIDRPLDLEVNIAPIRTGCGRERIERLWSTIGYEVSLELEDESSGQGALQIRSRTQTLRDVLRHLYVLIPAIDGSRHHYVTDDDIEILTKRGEGWLGDHPDRAWIAKRYMNRQRSLAETAIAQLEEHDSAAADDDAMAEELPPQRVSLQRIRIDTVAQNLVERGAKRVLDIGCGGGALTRTLVGEPDIEHVLALDASALALEHAERRMRRMPEDLKAKVKLVQGPASAIDPRWKTYDAAALVEFIEHIDPERWPPIERAVFAIAHPKTVIVTSPNREYNTLYGLSPDQRRHKDHRFEWDRDEFGQWATGCAAAHRYEVDIEGIGSADPVHGSPTLMAVFTAKETNDG